MSVLGKEYWSFRVGSHLILMQLLWVLVALVATTIQFSGEAFQKEVDAMYSENGTRGDISKKPRQPKVINGSTTQVGQFPFMVALLYRGDLEDYYENFDYDFTFNYSDWQFLFDDYDYDSNYSSDFDDSDLFNNKSEYDYDLGSGTWLLFCGGALYDSHYVITAAHCVQSESPEDLALGFNQWQANDENAVLRNVTEIIIHPGYGNLSAVHNDIALLRFDPPIEFTDGIQPVCMPEGPVIDNESLIIMGWGDTRETADGSYLQYATGLFSILFQIIFRYFGFLFFLQLFVH